MAKRSLENFFTDQELTMACITVNSSDGTHVINLSALVAKQANKILSAYIKEHGIVAFRQDSHDVLVGCLEKAIKALEECKFISDGEDERNNDNVIDAIDEIQSELEKLEGK